MKIKRVRASGSARLPRALRTIVNYVATCKDCDELPESPRKASVHAISEGHTVIETKSYVLTPADE